MNQSLAHVWDDVLDRSVTTGGLVSGRVADRNTAEINLALASGKHVLFPAGKYTFRGTLNFGTEYQRVTFLAGAILRPYDAHSWVSITGDDQTISGMRIEGPKAASAHSPIVDIDGAANLLMQDLHVAIGAIDTPTVSQRAAVRVKNLTKCKFIGGSISGTTQSGTIGLWLASEGTDQTGVYVVAGLGLTISGFGWAVRVGCICDDPTFIDCNFIDNATGGVNIADDGLVATGTTTPAYPVATALNLVSCRMVSSGVQQYVQVDEHCTWRGGVVLGCVFGETDLALIPGGVVSKRGVGGSSSSAAGKGEQGTGRLIKAGAPNAGTLVARRITRTPVSQLGGFLGPDSCIIRVKSASSSIGVMQGLVVSGCRSYVDGRSSVWYVEDTAQVSATCDMFNAWSQSTVAAGAKAGELVQMTTDASGNLIFIAESVQVQSDELGFFGEGPAPQSGPYTPLSTVSYVLGASNESEVLSQLIVDLGRLGLIKV